MLQPILLDNNALRSLASDSRYTERWPILRQLASIAQSTGGCGSCGQGTSATVDAIYNSVKRAIADLDKVSARELLTMLGASSIRIFYNDGQKTVDKTVVLGPDPDQPAS